MNTENILTRGKADQQASGPVNLTSEETSALQEMSHLEKGRRLSFEGAEKWNSFDSHSQIDVLISQDIKELRSKTVYESAMNKIHIANGLPV